MPAGNQPTLASDEPAGGHARPQSSPDVRETAAKILEYSAVAPYVFKALPEKGSPPLSASDIQKIVKFGCIGTTRYLLSNMVKLGLATFDVVPSIPGGEKKVYTRAPALVPDNFEIDSLDYAKGEE